MANKSVPITSISDVHLATDKLSASKNHSHRLQYMDVGQKSSGHTWAAWSKDGAMLTISGTPNGNLAVFSVQTEPAGHSTKTLKAHDRPGLGQCAAWSGDKKSAVLAWPQTNGAGYFLFLASHRDLAVVKTHQAGPVQLGPARPIPIFGLPTWDYSKFKTRKANLEKPYTPASLVDEVVASKPKIVSCDFEQGDDSDLKPYRRARIILDVGYDLFDQLYNGRAGIRGQHFMDPVLPNAGRRQRQYFILQWLGQFQAYLQKQPGWNTHAKQLEANRMARSLLHKRAKMWQVEKEIGKGTGQQLHVPRWASYQNTQANDPICKFLELKSGYVNAWVSSGQLAPYKKQILLMGHWIDDQGNFAPVKFIPKKKRQRDRQVTYLGFS